jgi:ComF family protein
MPPRCALCGGAGQRPTLDLCRACDLELPVLEPGCPRCGVAGVRDLGAVCGRCETGPPPFDRCYAAFVYARPIDSMIQSLKYHGRLAFGRVLGELLARSLLERSRLHDVDVVLPMPLHPQRHAARGFNQAAEIARWTTRRLDLRRDDSLAVRRLDRPPQVGQSPPQRRVNLIGAFVADRRRVGGRAVAVIDDVMTTGSTATALTHALLEAGALRVEVWCVAIVSRSAAPSRSGT